MDSRRIGVLGGGQLGRMMAEAGHRLGVKLAALDPLGSKSPAGELTDLCIEGSFQDAEKIKELAALSDLLTVEIEHVNVEALDALERQSYKVHPNSKTLRIIQDKFLQKVHLAAYGVPLPAFVSTPTVEAAIKAGKEFGYPLMLKNRRMAYDGKGNAVVESEEGIIDAFKKLGESKDGIYDVYAEKWASFSKELAVMIVRTSTGVVSYPVVETVQKDNICHLVIVPAQIPSSSVTSAIEIAKLAISSFDGIGIYGVELFLIPDGSVLLNEIAPRPHNSGHYTMEACDIDQFEMHLRAVLNLPCPTPIMRAPCAVMVNVLGESTMEATMKILTKSMSIPGTGIHWYGKSESRVGRKMAHLTITAENMQVLSSRFDLLGLDVGTRNLFGLQEEDEELKSDAQVGIIMGSDSDLPTMREAAEILESFGVSYELTIVSAHRTPTRMYAYAQSAVERGVKVIIAGAGGAAHLPGMVAALTPLPVIGVPVKTSALNGMDSLYSIVQMPRGIPVATVAIGNAANAGLLAIRILASGGLGGCSADGQRAVTTPLLEKMETYMARQEEEVLKKADRLESIGFKSY